VAISRAFVGWDRLHHASHAVRDAAHGRLYVRDGQAIVILRTDGTLVKRVEGFRFAQERPARG
jgi:hypothetical protein